MSKKWISKKKVNCNQIKNELQLDIERRIIKTGLFKINISKKSIAQKYTGTKAHKSRRAELVTG